MVGFWLAGCSVFLVGVGSSVSFPVVTGGSVGVVGVISPLSDDVTRSLILVSFHRNIKLSLLVRVTPANGAYFGFCDMKLPGLVCLKVG